MQSVNLLHHHGLDPNFVFDGRPAATKAKTGHQAGNITNAVPGWQELVPT